MSRGIFITMEGPDGSGKSTQISRLKEYLEKEGYNVLITREPGGTVISETIREIILNKDFTEMSPVTEMMLYASARAQLIAEVVGPAIDSGTAVISDRFVDSSLVYQGMARGMGMEFVAGLNMAATGGLKPDVTFFFDISAEEALERRGKRGEASDRIELAGLKFQEDVRRGYLELAKESDGRVITIDATKGIDEIFEVVKESLKGKI